MVSQTSNESFSQLVSLQSVGQSLDNRVSYSVSQPAINNNVSWLAPGQYSQLVSESTSHKSFGPIVSPWTVESLIQSINQL